MFVWDVFGLISPMKRLVIVLSVVLVFLALWMHDSHIYDNELEQEVGLVQTN